MSLYQRQDARKVCHYCGKQTAQILDHRKDGTVEIHCTTKSCPGFRFPWIVGTPQ